MKDTAVIDEDVRAKRQAAHLYAWTAAQVASRPVSTKAIGLRKAIGLNEETGSNAMSDSAEAATSASHLASPFSSASPLGAAVAIAVGFGCMLATLLIHTSAVTLFQRYSNARAFAGPASHIALEAALIASIAAGVLVVAFRRARLPSDGDGNAVPSIFLACVAAATYLAGSLLFCLLPAMSEEALRQWGCAAAGAVVGIGCPLELMAWGRLLRRFSLIPAACVISCSVLVSCALDFLMCAVPVDLVVPIFIACSAVAAAVPVVLSVSEERRRSASACIAGQEARKTSADSAANACNANDAMAEGTVRSASKASRIKGFLSVLAAPAVGLVLFAMIMSMRAQLFVEDMPYYLESQAISAVVLLACSLIPRLRPVIPIAYRSVIPVLAVIVLAFCSASLAIWGGTRFDIRLVFLLYSFAGILTVITLAGVAHAAEFPSDLIVLVAVALFALATLGTGWAARSLGQPEIRGFVMVVTGLYAVGMTLYSLFRSIRVEQDEPHEAFGAEEMERGRIATPISSDAALANSVRGRVPAGFSAGDGCASTLTGDWAAKQTGESPTGQTPNLADASGSGSSTEPGYAASAMTLAQRCDLLAERYHLTNREREVLGYLAQGHSAVYVSEVLLISPNTARTHVHNIYRKLDVASREELLLLVRDSR